MPIYIGLEFQQSPAFGRKVNGGMEWGQGKGKGKGLEGRKEKGKGQGGIRGRMGKEAFFQTKIYHIHH